jgi:hypothetical protein
MSTNMTDVVVHARGGIGRKIMVWDPIWKITKAKKSWRCGSSGRVPCLTNTVSWVQTLVLPNNNNINNNKNKECCWGVLDTWPQSRVERYWMHVLGLTEHFYRVWKKGMSIMKDEFKVFPWVSGRKEFHVLRWGRLWEEEKGAIVDKLRCILDTQGSEGDSEGGLGSLSVEYGSCLWC